MKKEKFEIVIGFNKDGEPKRIDLLKNNYILIIKKDFTDRSLLYFRELYG